MPDDGDDLQSMAELIGSSKVPSGPTDDSGKTGATPVQPSNSLGGAGDTWTHTPEPPRHGETMPPVGAKLGEGSFGTVYRSGDDFLVREVALKVLRPHHDSTTITHLFLREARLTARLQHPGIVPVYRAGIDPDGRPFYTMREIDGTKHLGAAAETFHEEWTRGRPDTVALRQRFRELLEHFTAACDAVHFAHTKGVIHRDLKPNHVVIGNHRETFVIDWGLAKDLNAAEAEASSAGDDSPLATKAGQTMGTPGYMSPEQAKGESHRATPFTDVFALGATLYTLLTGKNPYHGEPNINAVVEAAAAGRFPSPSSVKPGVPLALEAVCLKAMQPNPADRYPSAAELAAEVRRYLADDAPRVYRQSAAERLARFASRHRTAAVAVVGMVLVAAVGVATAVTVGRAWERESLLTKLEREREKAELLNLTDEFGRLWMLVRQHSAQRDYDRAAEFADRLVAVAHSLNEKNRVVQSRLMVAQAYGTRASVERERYSDSVAMGGIAKVFFRGVRLDVVTRGVIADYSKAIDILIAECGGDPSANHLRHFGLHYWIDRADTYFRLGRYSESLIDADFAGHFTNYVTGQHAAVLKMLHGSLPLIVEPEQARLPWSRGPAPDHAKAVRLHGFLAGRAGTSAKAVYNSACAFALASLDVVASAEEREHRSLRAVAYLDRLAKEGYFKDAKALTDLRTDKDLDALRGRKDFCQVLIAAGG